jgi:hypothetical protein
VRVVDCLLYEGQKVQFRVVLAIMNSYYRAYKSSFANLLPANGRQTVSDVGQDIAQFCRRINIGPDKLIKVCAFYSIFLNF